GVLAGDQYSRPEHREGADRPARRGSPLLLEEHGEGAGGERDREHGEEPDPEHRRERVVEDAVVDEGVAPGVPEVVPERETMPEKERALIFVGCEVDAG